MATKRKAMQMPESTHPKSLEREQSNLSFMKDSTILILGTEYNFIFRELKEDPMLESNQAGYTNPYIKTICIRIDLNEVEPVAVEMIKETIRHEILHAFLYESGLWANSFSMEDTAWSLSEEIVDWFAMQSPKIFALYKQLEVI